MSNKTYKAITEKIVTALENETIPWAKPWANVNVKDTDIPHNGLSKRAYNGLNLLLLACNNYKSKDYYTFKQASDLGASIKKGSKGNIISFFNVYMRDQANKTVSLAKFNSMTKDEKEQVKKFSTLRYYYVFNRDQIDGLPEPAKVETVEEIKTEKEKLESCENIIAGYKDCPEIEEKPSNKAFYNETFDFVTMPSREQFINIAEFYQVLFHELTHSTGIKKRLNRAGFSTYTGKNRAREELVAELGASFLCSVAGIDFNVENAAAYCRRWSQKLKDDPKAISLAAGAATKAANYILNIKK